MDVLCERYAAVPEALLERWRPSHANERESSHRQSAPVDVSEAKTVPAEWPVSGCRRVPR
ncbi:hypothetical protein FBY22_2112 [Streptomyces sp. SLBN-31]|nr:hypothetical protein FBY22_2112 [Streptomyces sp. SLBN-31]